MAMGVPNSGMRKNLTRYNGFSNFKVLLTLNKCYIWQPRDWCIKKLALKKILIKYSQFYCQSYQFVNKKKKKQNWAKILENFCKKVAKNWAKIVHKIVQKIVEKNWAKIVLKIVKKLVRKIVGKNWAKIVLKIVK